jgi:ribosome-associated translation inhibitor RaiA
LKSSREKGMIELNFKNMESSEYARQLVEEKLQLVVQRNPRLAKHRFRVVVERIDSGASPEPDLFNVVVDVHGMHFRQTPLSCKDPSLYRALGMVCEELIREVS